MKASRRNVALASVTLSVFATACGGVTLQPADGGSTAGNTGASGRGGGSGGAGGSVGAPCDTFDEASCKMQSDCEAYYCPGCVGPRFDGCSGPGEDNACPAVDCLAPCSGLDETTCKTRSDCQAYYCSACDGTQSFGDCGAPGGGANCPAIGCLPACGTIMASDYDRSCSANADCVPEPDGNFCDSNKCTNCANAAVSVKAQAQYEADLATKIPRPSVCPCPSGPIAVCNSGVCELESPQ
jgi:hypothetical protein